MAAMAQEPVDTRDAVNGHLDASLAELLAAVAALRDARPEDRQQHVAAARARWAELEETLSHLLQQLVETDAGAEQERHATREEVERRLHEIHARFETAFTNAPI